jgi:hypothetical protein
MDYCHEYTMRWFSSIEGPSVQCGALSEALGCDITIFFVSGKETDEIQELVHNIYNGEEKIGSVHCLLKPGHYDLLYLGKPGSQTVSGGGNNSSHETHIDFSALLGKINDTKQGGSATASP